MKKSIVCCFILFLTIFSLNAQDSDHQSTSMAPSNKEAKEALEVESLFPMFLTGGYHLSLGYRYEKIRVRISVINGGSYDAEKAGVNNSSSDFKRYYKTSPGVFLGYTVWKNLEVYTYLELHTFQIEQKSTGIKKDLFSIDAGGGVGYQFFIGKSFYIQPAFHVYCRKSKSLDFNGAKYTIPNVDLSPVIRVGYRLWSK
jgi:hypothetical protein